MPVSAGGGGGTGAGAAGECMHVLRATQPLGACGFKARPLCTFSPAASYQTLTTPDVRDHKPSRYGSGCTRHNESLAFSELLPHEATQMYGATADHG